MSNNSKSFWTTLPGILTGIAAIITAIGTTIAIIITNPPVTENGVSTTTTTGPSAADGFPDLIISEYSLNPSTPNEESSVSVSIRAYNQGLVRSGSFTVEWWAGENFADGPHCTWQIEGLDPKESRVLSCIYGGYESHYASLTTKVVIDPNKSSNDGNTSNNIKRMEISVRDIG